jgi:5'-nucleotidase
VKREGIQLADRLILITNDDGVNAPGLTALKRELDRVARVEVYAPDRNWSAASRTMTFHKPLRVDRVQLLDGTIGHVTSGTPSDCVSLALLGLLDARPDLVVSGINAGLNVGQDITYSGTVAAAMEGVRAGIPSVAVSFDVGIDPRTDPDYSLAARFAAKLASFLLESSPLPKGILLNVNVPSVPQGKKPEVKLTRLGGQAFRNYLVTGKDPRGRSYYWITGDPLTDVPPEEEGTDIWAIANDHISITPIHLDMTEYSLLKKLESWEERSWFGDD